MTLKLLSTQSRAAGNLSVLCFRRCPGTPHSPVSFCTGCSLSSKASFQPRTFLRCLGRIPFASLYWNAWMLRSRERHSVTPLGCVITPPSLPPAVYTYDSRDQIVRVFSMGAILPQKEKKLFWGDGESKKTLFFKIKNTYIVPKRTCSISAA